MAKQFQNTYTPSRVSPPGDTLAELLDQKEMSQEEFAKRCGRPKKTINEIIKAKTAITPGTALQFERVLNTPAEFWNKRESNYREYLARKLELEKLKTQGDWLDQFPVNQMIKFGWIQDLKKQKVQQSIELLNFFGIATPEQWDLNWKKTSTAFRKSTKVKSSAEAISVWLRKGEIDASKVICKQYDKKKFEQALTEIRELTTESDPDKFLPLLIDKCSNAGVIIALVPNLQGAPISGAARWLSSNKALIQLSFRYKTDDHFWFSFFHEAGHILLHSKKQIFVDLSNNEKDENSIEQEANHFASEKLFPKKVLDKWLSEKGSGKISQKSVVDLAEDMQISPGIIVGRLQHMKIIPMSNLNKLKVRYVWSHQ